MGYGRVDDTRRSCPPCEI